MPVLRSGVVSSAGYARKLRKALFAQTSALIKQGTLKQEDVARASAELNSILYDILVEKMKVARDNVVRISIEYEVEGGQIVWKMDSLKIELWQKVPEEEVERRLRKALQRAEEVTYELKILAETEGGDLVFVVTAKDSEVGAFLVTPLDSNQFVVRGALLEPRPTLVKRTIMSLKKPVQELAYEDLKAVIDRGVECSEEEAEKVIREIKILAE